MSGVSVVHVSDVEVKSEIASDRPSSLRTTMRRKEEVCAGVRRCAAEGDPDITRMVRV